MCFKTKVSSSTTTTEAAPTTVSVGEAQTQQDAASARRKKLRSQAGYSQNILAGETSSAGKKALTGD